MKLKFLLIFLTVIFFSSCQTKDKNESVTLKWTEVESIPASFGNISKGVSAAFVGLLEDKLIVAGGCNFPDTPAAEGGKKVFYRDILMLDNGKWISLGELPEPLAYGVSVTTDEEIFFIGGQNEKSVKSVFRLRMEDEKLQIEVISSLPVAIDNAAGYILGSKIFIAGGNQDGKPSSDVWSYDLLNSENWQKEFSLPIQGGLVQPALASQNVALYKKMKELADAQINVSMSVPQLFVFGGFSPATDNNPASVNQDVWNLNELSPEWVKSFNPFPSGETKNSLSGGVAVAFQDSLILLLGGVNKQVFEDALNRNYHLSKSKDSDTDTLTNRLRAEAAEYLLHPAEWYRFNDELWLYNVNRQEWKSLGKFPQAALAGASAIGNDNEIYIVNGEIKPGIRTRKIWKITW